MSVCVEGTLAQVAEAKSMFSDKDDRFARFDIHPWDLNSRRANAAHQND